MSTPATTILITGASSGLGAEMARQFAALGYDLALAARRVEKLESLRAEIGAAHPDRRVELRALDVDDDQQVFEVFAELRDTFGRIDRVVVNAGIGRGYPLGKKGSGVAGLEGWAENRATAMTNFVAAACQMDAAMALFREAGGGHLVVISSVTAKRGMPHGMAMYAATKAGIAHLAEGLRLEYLGRPEFQFTVLYPGYIDSEMTAGNKSRLVASAKRGVGAMVAAIEKRVPSASVPAWPWKPLGFVLAHAPLKVVKKLT